MQVVETLFQRGRTLVRRQRLAPGEATPWHVDPYRRLTVVLSGDALAIEYRDGGEPEGVPLQPVEAGWDEPEPRVHRAVNTGREPFEEVVIFFLDADDADPRPGSG